MFFNNKIIFYTLFSLILIAFCSCQFNPACSKCADEKYIEEQVDTNVLVHHNSILTTLADTSIKDLEYSAYQLLFYSAHGFGQSIKFEKKREGYFLKVKSYAKGEVKGDFEYANYQTQITDEDWNKLEDIIYEFNFWTAPKFKPFETALDGFSLFIEGTRPEAGLCFKRTHQLICRISPRFDKMNALGYSIREYEFHLRQQYGMYE